MRIILIHAKINFDNMEPLGLLSLATVLSKKGHVVRVVDIFPEDDRLWLDRILSFQPELVGYSIESPSYARIREIHSELVPLLQHSKFCAGGIHTTAVPEMVCQELQLDFVIIGEGERSLVDAVSLLERGASLQQCQGIGFIRDGVFFASEKAPLITDLDSLPIINRTLIYDYNFYLQPPGNIRGLVIPKIANVLASRGCPGGCIFCESRLVMGHRFRQRSVAHIMNEIHYLASNFDINGVYFVDDMLATDNEWLIALCDALIISGFNLVWGCQCRADRLSDNLIGYMKRAGCIQIDMGVETGDPQVLKTLGKGETIDDFISAANLVHKHKLRLLCSFVIGSPGETWESIQLTRGLITKLHPSLCQYFTLIPYPGSPLWKIAQKKGWVQKYTFTKEGSQKEYHEGVLNCGLDPKAQIMAKKWLQRKTVFRDYFLLFLGWFSHPGYILVFGAIIVKNAFYIKTLVTATIQKNPLMVLHTIYSDFNKYLLHRVRTKI